MGAHSAGEPVKEPVNEPVKEPVNDPGNSEPGAYTVDLDDDELADVLALLAEEDEIRDNQRMLREQGILPDGAV